MVTELWLSLRSSKLLKLRPRLRFLSLTVETGIILVPVSELRLRQLIWLNFLFYRNCLLFSNTETRLSLLLLQHIFFIKIEQCWEQGGIKYFTSWEPILSARNFARNSGSQTRQRAFKIAVIWVLNMWFTHLYFLNYISIYFCLSQEISSCDKKFLTVSWNSFLWQDVSCCDKKLLLMPSNFCLWQESSSCDKIFFPVTRKFFLWQEISTLDKRFLSVTRNVQLCHEIHSCDKMFLFVTRNFF